MGTSYNYSDARKRAEDHERNFESKAIRLPDGIKQFKVTKPGTVRLDIIPYVVGEGNPYAAPGTLHPERTYFVHPRIGPNEDSYICPQATAGKPCPVCEHQRVLKRDEEADEELIKALYPRERQLFHVIDLDDPKQEVQIWDVSYHLFGKKLDAEIRNADEADGWHLYYHLRKGFTLKIGFKEKRLGKHAFYEAETIQFKPRAQGYGDDVLSETHCLDKLLLIPEYDELKDVFAEGASKPKTPARGGAGADDQPTARRRPPPDDEPARGGRGEDDLPPPRSRRAPPPDDEQPPPRRRPAPPPEEEAPKRAERGGKPPADDWDDERETPPARRQAPPPEEEKPSAQSRRRAAPPAEEETTPPKKNAGKPPPADDWD